MDKFNARVYFHFMTSTRAPHVVGNIKYGPPSRALAPVLWSYGMLSGDDPENLFDEINGLTHDEAIGVILSKIPRLGSTPHQIYIEGFWLDNSLDKPPFPKRECLLIVFLISNQKRLERD